MPGENLDELKEYLDSVTPEQGARYLVDNWDTLPTGGREQLRNILEELEPVDALKWMTNNWATIPPEVADSLAESFSLSQDDPTLEEAARHIADGDFLAWIASQRVDAAADGAVVSADLDADGEVSDEEREAYTTATEEKAAEKEEDTRVPADQTKEQITSATEGLRVHPQEVLLYTGGKDPTDEQLDDLLDAYNEFSDVDVTSTEELYGVITARSQDPLIKDVLDKAFLGADPIVSYSIPLLNGQTVTVTQDQFAAFKGAFGEDATGMTGFDVKDLTTIIRTADRVGLTDATGGNGWQILAALTRASNLHDVDTTIPEASIDVDRAGMAEALQRDGNLRDWAEAQRSGENGPVTVRNSGERLAAAEKKRWVNAQLGQLGLKFNEGKSLYGNDQLAYIHALDSSLAARLARTAPEKQTPEDRQKATQLLLNGGFDIPTLAGMGYYALGLEDYYTQQGAGGSGSGGGSRRYFPDPDTVKQASKDLYRRLFLEDPTDAELGRFVREVRRSIVSAEGGDTDVDPNAQIQRYAESLPQYRELYGNKPSGITEDAYRAQFEATAGSILDPNTLPNPEAIRAGMRTGDTKTTLDMTVASEQGLNSSTFMERVARASEILARNT